MSSRDFTCYYLLMGLNRGPITSAFARMSIDLGNDPVQERMFSNLLMYNLDYLASPKSMVSGDGPVSASVLV